MFGLMIEADMFEDGIGTTKEDEDLFREVSLKVYGLTNESTDEEFEKAEEVQMQDVKNLVKVFRGELQKMRDSE